MLKKLFATDDKDIAGLILRVTIGLIMLPHGAQKMLGWFGGYGFEGTMGFFTGQMGIPAVFAFLAIFTEFFGALALVAGLFTRLAAFGMGVIMAVAIITVHAGNGFFMNWFGNQKGEGFEYHLLVLGIAIAVMIRGAGAFSLDSIVAKIKQLESCCKK